MSNKRITDLTELTTPTTDDVFPVVDIATNTTTKVQLANLPVQTAVTTALATKQATLVSGTNIKTVNSTTLLGSGDIAVQPTLVSGTSIKTVNSNSLLGAGDVAVQETLVSGTNIKTLNSVSLLGAGNIVLAATPSGVAGAIQFSNGSAFASDATNLFWDDTNNRLGIGTNTPNSLLNVIGTGGVAGIRVNTSGADSWMPFSDGNWYVRSNGVIINDNNTAGVSIGINSPTTARLFVKGSGSTSATTSLLVQNSAGTAAMSIKDDLSVIFNGTTTFNNDFFATGANQMKLYGYSFVEILNGVSGTRILIGTTTARLNNKMIVGTTASDAVASAQFQIDSTTTGFLPPRMTTTQKNAIASPAAGLVLYDSTTNKLQCYNGSTWNDLF
jgi:hypothetical protein